jgi:CheY-like chemotaxis protein
MSSNPAIRPPSRTILVVDDDATHRGLCERVLRTAGHDVLPAADGAAALRTLATNTSISLVLLDFFMPEKDGFDFLNAIRSRQPKVPVIAMSGGGLVTSPKEALGHSRLLGASAVLQKPFSAEGLLRAVNDVFAGAS